MQQDNTEELVDSASTKCVNRDRELDEARSKRVVGLAKHIR
jgi:hypothetical protein